MKAGGIFGESFSGLGAADTQLQQAACSAANNLGREDGIHGNHRSTSQVVAYMESFMDMQGVSTTAVFGCYETGYAKGAAEYEASKGYTVNTPRPDTASEEDRSFWGDAFNSLTAGGGSTATTAEQKQTLQNAACEMANYMGHEHGVSIGKMQPIGTVRTYMNQRVQGLKSSDVTDAYIYRCYTNGFNSGQTKYNESKGQTVNDPRANAKETEKAFRDAASTGSGATVGTSTGAKTGSTGSKTGSTTSSGGGKGGSITPSEQKAPQAQKPFPIALVAGVGLVGVGAVLLLTKKKKGKKAGRTPSKKPTKR